MRIKVKSREWPLASRQERNNTVNWTGKWQQVCGHKKPKETGNFSVIFSSFIFIFFFLSLFSFPLPLPLSHLLWVFLVVLRITHRISTIKATTTATRERKKERTRESNSSIDFGHEEKSRHSFFPFLFGFFFSSYLLFFEANKTTRWNDCVIR